jgi:hypothetical protein
LSVYSPQTELLENGAGAMPDREIDEKNETKKRQHGGPVHLKPAGEALVKPQETPVEPPDKQIHPRRPLPLVAEDPDDPEQDE